MRTTKAKFLLRPVINRHGAARECALKELRRTVLKSYFPASLTNSGKHP